jgi:hypothetical protein
VSWAHRLAPDPAEAGPGLRYRCQDCDWRGQGGADAYDHHRRTHHVLVLPTGDTAIFACCALREHVEVSR